MKVITIDSEGHECMYQSPIVVEIALMVVFLKSHGITIVSFFMAIHLMYYFGIWTFGWTKQTV